MDDLFDAVLDDAQSSPSRGDLLGGLLEALLGGAMGQGDLMEGVLGGGGGGQPVVPGGQMPLGGGGGQPVLPSGQMPLGGGSGQPVLPGGQMPMGGGGALPAASGGQMPMGGGLMDILGMILGGGGASQLGGNPNLAPFTEALSEKLGISPQMASLLIGAGFSLLAGLMRGRGQGERGMPAGADLDSLLDEEYLTSSGVASQVAQQTGLDEETAAHHLREAMVLLAAQPPAGGEATPKPRQSKPTELDNLLDTWETD